MSKSSQRRRVVAARRFKQILAASIFAAGFFGSSVLKGDSPAQPIINRYVAERQVSATSDDLPPVVQRAKHDAPAKALPSTSQRRPKPVAIQAAFESPADSTGIDSGVRQTSGKQEPTPAKPRAVTIQPAPEELPPILTGAEMRAKLAPLVSGAEMRAQKAAEAAKQAKVQTQAKAQAKATEIVAESKKKGMQKVEKALEAVPATAQHQADSPSPWMQSLSAASKEVTASKPAAEPVVMASREMPIEPIAETQDEAMQLPPVRLGSPKAAKPAPVAMAPARAMAPAKPLYRSQQVAAQFEEEDEAKPAPKAEEPAPLELTDEAPAPAAPAEEEPAMLAPADEAAPGDEGGALFREIKEMGDLEVMVHRSKILRTKTDLYRTAVVDDGICEIVQFTPRELSIIGKSQGATHVTFWFDDPKADPVT
ncbi:MAG: pilus assembly protein N-terminal domain-containing protein, partial [Pirellulales bacterium]